MRDVGHCMMPYDKDDEFGLFYDFSRAYRDLPQLPMLKAAEEAENKEEQERKIEKNQRMAASGDADVSAPPIEGQDEESDDWEDIDCSDGEMEDVEEVASEEEDSSDPPSEESKSFVVLQGNSNLGASNTS